MSAFSSTFAPAANASSSPTLTSAVCVGNGFVNPRFGRRRWMGVWPPSKCGVKLGTRAYGPFCPPPEGLPRPDPVPRPTRVFGRVAPAGFASLLRVSAIVHLLDLYEVHDLLDRTTERWRIPHDDRAARPAQAEPVDRGAHRVLLPDRALLLGHAKLGLHDDILRGRLGSAL